MSLTLHTTQGDIKVELDCAAVPRSAANFLALCASGLYKDTPFHRVSANFMVQAGDPTGTGKISTAAFARRLPDQIAPSLTFSAPGILAFANNGRPSRKGVGSQFFLTAAPAPHLDATCTIIGRALHGLSVVQRISNLPAENGRPVDPVSVTDVTIHANPFATGDLQFELPP